MLVGNTVHVVPVEGGNWQVVDQQRRQGSIFPSRRAAVARAKVVAEATPPSQVVLFDELGQLVPIAHYQLPQYQQDQSGSSAIEAAVKAFVIAGLLAAGVAVLADVVESVDRELKRETSKARRSKVRRRH